MKKWIFILTFLGLLSFSGKLFGFTLTVTPTHETCSGNGSLTFNVTNPDPGGSITYLVYLLPNTTTPYATLNTPFLGGLSAGTYRVIATETVGTVATTQQVDVTVNDNTGLLTYNVQILNQACATTSNIIVNVTVGTGVTYEIFAGPVTFPLQASNTFSGLPVGVYQIRVFDACGNGIPSTFTVTLNPTGLTIGPPVFTPTTPPSCTATVVTNTITPAPGTVIAYPLAIQYTVFPPGGGTPIVTNTNLLSGNATSQPISTTIPSYGNLPYSYEVQITDACGGPPFVELFNINPSITLIGTTVPITCNQNYINLTAGNFTPPYTLNFTAFPAGFNPATFNATYPGPYNNALTTFGSSTQAVPIGNYVVTITDACGRTRTSTFNVLDLPPVPVGTGTNNGCLTNSGQIVVSIPNYEIVTAIITVAPASYPFPLPHNVTASIDANHILTLNPVPLGNYTFQLTDECGNIIPAIDVTVPVYVDRGLDSGQRPGCELNKGSVLVNSLNGRLTSITITSAPAGFTTPFDASSNISSVDGVFYMNNLDAGSYTFRGVDECNFTNDITVVVDGYFVSGTFSLVANCGSFNVPLAYTSNGLTSETFWLQKQIDATTDTWAHPAYPVFGAIYTNGTVPTSATGIPLINNTNNLNQFYNGTFRIVRSFLSYNNGSAINSGTVTTPERNCIEYLSPTLSFNQTLEIVDINRMSCSAAGTLDVVVTALGSPPLHYYLLAADGVTVLVDNGSSNIFLNVAPGVYYIRLEDPCGGIRSRGPFDVSTLLSLVTITQPDAILQCRTIITGSETFDLTTQSATILGSQSPTDYTLTYHTSLADAQNGVGAIVGPTQNAFNPTTNPQTMYARVIFNQLPNCYEVTSFDLIVGQTPRLNLNPNYLNCTTTPVTLNASVGNLPGTTYLWSDGDTNPVKVISQIGETLLSVTATNDYGSGGTCTNTKSVTVVLSRPPTIEGIQTTDWTDDENTITILTSNTSAYEYSLDGVTFQDENTFYNLVSGLYTVTIRDKAGCGSIQKIVWLLNYPKFFTPNGDGINETWYIKNQQFEPDFTVEVFDRYGKLIKSFKSNTMGWDGTYNGAQNFSTDYWFVVHRQDGRIHRGHFALKR